MSNCSKCKQRDKDISNMLDNMYKQIKAMNDIKTAAAICMLNLT